MEKIVRSTLMPELYLDTRLHPTAGFVRVQLQNIRIDTLNGHAQRLTFRKETLRRAIRRLIECGWAYEHPGDDSRSPLIVPWMPPDVERMIVNELIKVRREVGPAGEWLMKCILYVAVDEHDFRDNVRPEWFTLGVGRGRFEMDRWFRRANVAVEFHGMQHYQYDPKFHKSREEFAEQQVRDNAKVGLCARRGIRYVEIPAPELGFAKVVNRVEDLLPLRPVRMDSPLVVTLDDLCRSYVNTVRRAQRRPKGP